MIEICTVGGYKEVGKNMTAVKVDDEVFIIDMGLLMEEYIRYTEDEDVVDLSPHTLMKIGAVPNINLIADWKSKVKAIIATHAHLDHIGAIPFLANAFRDAPVLATPFTIAVLNDILKDEKHKANKMRNKIIPLPPNSFYDFGKVKIEFIHITHSVPQTVMVAIHTKYGIILYANDFKLDNNPVLGKKPNYKRFRELSKQNVLVLILDSIYSSNATKTPSEAIAREMLRDVMLELAVQDNAVIVTTFSSHIARLKSIIDFGKRMKRKIIFIGRSLAKYVEAAESIGLVKFSKDVEIVKYRDKVEKRFAKLKKENLKDYLLVVTGHQGEKKAILSKMTRHVLPFEFKPGDCVIFSCNVIPAEVNIQDRKELESVLMSKKVRIFRSIHVSGHAAREDQRELISMLKPAHVIPAHGDDSMQKAMGELSEELGYKIGKTVHLMKDGQRLRII